MTTGQSTFHPASPIAIRDGTFDRVSTVAGLANVFKARTQPTQDDHLPFAAVWYAGERTQPNGDANTGAPEFIHTLTLVIDVAARAADETALDAEIVGFVETIRATLLTDPTWVMLFEGIEKVDTRYSYPKDAADIFVQAMIEIEVTFRSVWQPVIANDLKRVDVTVLPTRRTWACGLCGAPNEPTADTCSICGAPAPQPTAFPIEIDLDPPSC